MRRIRIARVITRLNVGGPAYQALILSNRLAERFETLLICGRPEKAERQFDRLIERYPCRLEICPYLRRRVDPIADMSALRWLVRAFRRFRPDIVHTHTAKAGTLGRIAAKLVGCPVIVHTFHGHVMDQYFSPLVSRCIGRWEGILARFTDAIVALSPTLKGQLECHLGKAAAGKVRVIPLGLPLEQFPEANLSGQELRRRLGIGDHAVVFGTLGRLAPIKDQALMIRAFAQAVKELAGWDLHLLIGGTGPLLMQLQCLAQRQGVGNRVHFIGQVDDLPAFYAAIDAAVLTSRNEGTPVMLLEALAAGRFVIASSVGGVGDIVPDEAGALIASRDMRDYAAAMSRFVRDRPQGLSMQKRRDLARAFSPEQLVEKVVELYDELVGNKTMLQTGRT